MSARGPMITGTVLSLAAVSAWSYMASLAIGPAAPLHLGRNLLSDYWQLAAARPVLEDAGTVPGPAPDAPREQPGSALRDRLAYVRDLNEGHPLPSWPGAPSAPPGAPPVVPGVPPEVAAGLVRALAKGPLSAASAGLTLGMSKSAAHRHLAALHQAGVVEKARGAGRSAGWQLAGQRAAPPQYTTIEVLAQAVHDGLVEADDEQRAVLEQALEIASRPRLTLLQGGSGGGQ